MKGRVLITGIEGFTGRHLARHLYENGYVVCGTTRQALAEMPGVSALYTADLSRAEDWGPVMRDARPDYIIHLAGIAFAAGDDLAAYYAANAVGTHHVLNAAAQSGQAIKNIIVASSAAVYGAQQGGVIAEDAPLNPQSHYGISKLAAEYAARTFLDRLPVAITRPFNYTGPGQPEYFVLPKIVKHFLDRAAYIELGNIDVDREFNDISFVCDVYQRLLDCPDAIGGAVNICTGRGYSLRTVLDTASAVFGHDLEIRTNPAFIRPNEPKILVGDHRRLETLVGAVACLSLERVLKAMGDAPIAQM